MTHAHARRSSAKDLTFGFRGPENVTIYQKSQFQKFNLKNNTFPHHTWVRENKNVKKLYL